MELLVTQWIVYTIHLTLSNFNLLARNKVKISQYHPKTRLCQWSMATIKNSPLMWMFVMGTLNPQTLLLLPELIPLPLIWILFTMEGWMLQRPRKSEKARRRRELYHRRCNNSRQLVLSTKWAVATQQQARKMQQWLRLVVHQHNKGVDRRSRTCQVPHMTGQCTNESTRTEENTLQCKSSRSSQW